MSDSPRLKTVCIATPSVIGPRAVSTGIVKRPIEGKIQVTEMGLEGDFQVDSRVHGGLDKALYQFPFETYTTLAEALPHLAARFSSPCVGENLSSSGMTDNTVYVAIATASAPHYFRLASLVCRVGSSTSMSATVM
ncbi:hypothetical protein AT251_19620 [Enterovibrio nigricans]|nr:MOSC domain-containing protein [Enterovibrio nigricans]PKF49338.1 hypothetical protein AT251_19620 [Enterovibrio nigricans]